MLTECILVLVHSTAFDSHWLDECANFTHFFTPAASHSAFIMRLVMVAKKADRHSYPKFRIYRKEFIFFDIKFRGASTKKPAASLL
jgi:hypothetical protein